MDEPAHDAATAWKQALAELRAIKEMRGRAGEAALLKDPEYLAAAWRVVELNQGLIHLTLQEHWYGTSYSDAAMHLTLTLFNACWNYEDSLGAFSTYAMACMRGAAAHIHRWSKGGSPSRLHSKGPHPPRAEGADGAGRGPH